MSQIIGDIKVADTLDQQPKTIDSNESIDVKIVDRVKDGKGTPSETINACLNTPAKSQRTIMDVKSEIEAKRKVHQELKTKAQERQTKQDSDMKHTEETKGETTDPKRTRGPLTGSEFQERLRELQSVPWVSPKRSGVFDNVVVQQVDT